VLFLPCIVHSLYKSAVECSVSSYARFVVPIYHAATLYSSVNIGETKTCETLKVQVVYVKCRDITYRRNKTCETLKVQVVYVKCRDITLVTI